MRDESMQDEKERQYAYIERARKHVEKLTKELGRKPVYHVTTFGCQMNARDSEKLCGILEEAGFAESEEENADFVIFNTCTVRYTADWGN